MAKLLRAPLFSGVAILTLAVGIGSNASSLLYGVSPMDPLTLGTVAVGLSVVALLASWLPARRASRVDPVVALRFE